MAVPQGPAVKGNTSLNTKYKLKDNLNKSKLDLI
jgi:hypothetical protein